MNYEHVLGGVQQSLARAGTIRLGLVGPKGAFGRSLLAQCRALPTIVAPVRAGSIVPLSALDLAGSGLFAAWQRNP